VRAAEFIEESLVTLFKDRPLFLYNPDNDAKPDLVECWVCGDKTAWLTAVGKEPLERHSVRYVCWACYRKYLKKFEAELVAEALMED